MCVKQYNLDDYANIQETLTYELSEETLKIIDDLSIEVDEYIKTLPVTTNDNYDDKKRNRRNYKNHSKGQSSNDDTWSKKEPFKATKIERREEKDKYLEEFASILNKITKKTYESHHSKIFNLLDNVLQDDSDSEDESDSNNNEYIQISNTLFDIIKRVRIGFDLYGTLFKDIVTKYPMFIESISSQVKVYLDSYSDIQDVDPNTEYDAYCDMNKLNDKRRSMSGFIVELYKNKLLSELELQQIIQSRIQIVLDNIDIDEKTSLIEETTENLFVFITNVKGNVDFEIDEWVQILENITKCSKLKAREHKSISSRMIFKYMDIIDALKKK